MARKFQRLAIITSFLIVLFAYLYHVPNSQGVPQMGRIRLISASMKVIGLIVSIISSNFFIDIFSFLIYIGLCI
jgi:multisubunit Na+/H+ antiporter MnhB subunit